MEVTSREGKHTIEFIVEKYNDELEITGKFNKATKKEAKITQKVMSMPRSPPPFREWLMKKNDERKYSKFIRMLKQISINVSLVENLK